MSKFWNSLFKADKHLIFQLKNQLAFQIANSTKQNYVCFTSKGDGYYIYVEYRPVIHGPSLLFLARESLMLPSWPLVLIVTRKFWRLFYFESENTELNLTVFKIFFCKIALFCVLNSTQYAHCYYFAAVSVRWILIISIFHQSKCWFCKSYYILRFLLFPSRLNVHEICTTEKIQKKISINIHIRNHL